MRVGENRTRIKINVIITLAVIITYTITVDTKNAYVIILKLA